MQKRVVLVLAGDTVDISWLKPWLTGADLILAADAGADLVVAAGLRPDFLVGDLDSVSVEGRAAARNVVETKDQDFSDCEKLLAFATDQGIDSAVVVGAAGNRVDHMLGTIQAVARWEGRALIAYERQLLRVLRGPASESFKGPGLISALPLGPCLGVSMSNVRWPLDRVEMGATGFSSLSNESFGVAQVSLEAGVLAVFWAYDGQPHWSATGS